MGRKGQRKKRMEWWAILGIVATVVVGLGVYFLGRGGEESVQAEPESSPPEITESAPVIAADPVTPEVSSSPATRAPSASPTEDYSRIDLEVQKASNGWGEQFSEGRFALGTKGRLGLDITWAVYSRSGTKMDSDAGCEVQVELSGPGGDQGKTFGSCTGTTGTAFDGFPEDIEDPGEWTVTVRDTGSGLQEQAHLQVDGVG